MKKKLLRISAVNVGLLTVMKDGILEVRWNLGVLEPKKPKNPISQIISFLAYREDQLIIIYMKRPTPKIRKTLLEKISQSSTEPETVRMKEGCTICEHYIELWEGKGIHAFSGKEGEFGILHQLPKFQNKIRVGSGTGSKPECGDQRFPEGKLTVTVPTRPNKNKDEDTNGFDNPDDVFNL